MPFDLHTIESPDGSALANYDRIVIGAQSGVANIAGSGAGASATTAVSFGALPPNYSVSISASQACFVAITDKTSTGFNVVQTPTLGSVTLAAGTFDAVVVG
jgi:hypothetical protein